MLASVAADALYAVAGRRATFHGFKWRVAMAVAASEGTPNVAIHEIRAAFERAVPDRRGLTLPAVPQSSPRHPGER